MTHIKNILRGPDSIIRFRWMRHQVKVQSSSQKRKKKKKKKREEEEEEEEEEKKETKK